MTLKVEKLKIKYNLKTKAKNNKELKVPITKEIILSPPYEGEGLSPEFISGACKPCGFREIKQLRGIKIFRETKP